MVPKQGSVGASGLAALLYRLVLDAGGPCSLALLEHDAEGVNAAARPPHVLYLRRGFLVAARVHGRFTPIGSILRAAGEVSEDDLRRAAAKRPGLPELQGRLLCTSGVVSLAALGAALHAQALERLAWLCSRGSYRYEILDGVRPAADLGGHPIPLVPLLREEIVRRLDAVGRAQLAAAFAGKVIALRPGLAPPRTFTTVEERTLLSRLGEGAAFESLLPVDAPARGRLLALLGFLRAVGAVAVRAPAEAGGTRRPRLRPRSRDDRARAARLLGVPEAATPQVARRAYLRLARELHPDYHGNLPERSRAELAARFSQVAEAYRMLAGG